MSSRYRDALSAHLADVRAGRIAQPEGVTHCMELLLLFRAGVAELGEWETTQYRIDGLRSEVKFADGKTYEVEIREVRS